MIVLDFGSRGKDKHTSGWIAYAHLKQLSTERYFSEARYYLSYVDGGKGAPNDSDETLARMNKCINLPNRVAKEWLARVVVSLLEQ